MPNTKDLTQRLAEEKEWRDRNNEVKAQKNKREILKYFRLFIRSHLKKSLKSLINEKMKQGIVGSKVKLKWLCPLQNSVGSMVGTWSPLDIVRKIL